MGVLDQVRGLLGKQAPAAGAAKPLTAGERKDVLEEEVRVAETKLLKHEIDEQTFRQLVEQKQTEIVLLEAQMESEKAAGDITRAVEEKTRTLPVEDREPAAALVRQKLFYEKMLEIANRKYLKRLMREETYLTLSRDVKKKTIALEAQLNLMYKAAARRIMVETQAKLAKAGVEESAFDLEKAAEEIAEQSPRKPVPWPQTQGENPPKPGSQATAVNDRNVPRRLRRHHE